MIGAGGAARGARARRCRRDARVFTRRGDWPPDADGCDLIVNATPVRDELLVEPHAGQTVVDLAYAPTARRRRSSRRRAPPAATVVDGLEALVRQGAASFELWTGVARRST